MLGWKSQSKVSRVGRSGRPETSRRRSTARWWERSASIQRLPDRGPGSPLRWRAGRGCVADPPGNPGGQPGHCVFARRRRSPTRSARITAGCAAICVCTTAQGTSCQGGGARGTVGGSFAAARSQRRARKQVGLARRQAAFCLRSRAWAGWRQNRCRSPTRASGRNHLRQGAHGRLRDEDSGGGRRAMAPQPAARETGEASAVGRAGDPRRWTSWPALCGGDQAGAKASASADARSRSGS